MCVLDDLLRTIKTKWCLVMVIVIATVVEVTSLNGANVCMVKQKYNITKRVKYRAPMSVRTYEWCFSMPPRCSKWNTEMRDLTRLETEERVAEVSVCCPGYKMQDVSCIPICPNGKTGLECTEGCPLNKWGPNCVHDCKTCSDNGLCSPVTGECVCKDGWQGESCQTSMSTTVSTSTMSEILTTLKATTQIYPVVTNAISSSTVAPSTTTSLPLTTAMITRIITTSSKIPITEKMTTPKPIMSTKATILYSNVTITPKFPLTTNKLLTEEVTKRINNLNYAYNRTEPSVETKTMTTEAAIPIRRILKLPNNTTLSTSSTTNVFTVATPKMNIVLTTKETTVPDTTKKSEATAKFYPTTLKFKPKEIWIKPAQKGESPLIEIKTIQSHESHTKPKSSTKKEITIENTTPKTIIVSIIPTSISYATFKKMALTTSSLISQKNSTTVRANQSSEGITKSMSVSTSIPYTIKLNTLSSKQMNSTTATPFTPNVTKSHSTLTRRSSTKATPVNNKTNSMSTNVVRLSSLTTISSNATLSTRNVLHKLLSNDVTVEHTTERVTTRKMSVSKQFVAHQRNLTANTDAKDDKESIGGTNVTKQNVTNSKTNKVTVEPDRNEETFNILTEPEHITAVMGEKGTDRTSVDLVSVISIAGGIMMAVITVAVIIVMIERCKRPRYEDVRKINDIRMQVMIDNNDVPPPYVRSIFHTPLPEPPTSDKCHYQPISTLDRNLKQFMRPVVVQTISPIMLENFRGILECHYDHLPRRNHDYGTMPARFNTAPPVIHHDELRATRAVSVTESTIEALKCEAKLDVIDTSTAEPLYAEIPCWRPPSEHAIEIININGEAVTEL